MEYIFFKDSSLIKGVNTPKSQLGFQTMCKICSAAETLFYQKGFYETSITDICKLANTASGTFYIYFQNKTSVYTYLIKNYYEVIKNYLNEHISGCKTRREMEQEGLKAFIRFGHKNPQCYKIIWGCSYIDPALFEEYYTNFAKSYASILKKFSKELIDIDYSTIAWFLMGVANFICLKVILEHKRLTEKRLDALVDDVMKLFSTGLFK